MQVLGTTYLTGCNYQVGYDLLSQNVSANSSTLRVYGVLNVTNSYIAWSRGTATVYGTTWNLGTRYNKGSYVVVQADVTIYHNADGTKTEYIGGSLNTTFVSGTTGGNATLPTIPRKSGISSFSGTIGTKINISWNRASANFKHTLKYKFEDVEETIGTNLDTNVEWTPPESLYKFMSDVNSKNGSLILTTYNGNSNLGSNSATLILNVDKEKTLPNIESTNIIDKNEKTLLLTGNEKTLILYSSIAECSVSFKANKYSTLKSMIINGIDVTQSVTSATEEPVESTKYSVNYIINEFNSKTIPVLITDSRNNTLQYNLIPEKIIEYIKLSCNPKIQREQPTTGIVALEFNGNYFNGSFGKVNNELSIGYKYRKKGETDYTDIKYFLEQEDYKITNNSYFSGKEEYTSKIQLLDLFDYRNDYEFVLILKDKLSELLVNLAIVKGIPIVWWNGSQFTVNGDFYIADSNGENATLVFTTIDV